VETRAVFWRLDHPRRRRALGVSALQLALAGGGFDYTAADCMGWMADAGFRETRAGHLIGPDSMVVGIKWVVTIRRTRPTGRGRARSTLENPGRRPFSRAIG
jgi:hypothetical protein